MEHWMNLAPILRVLICAGAPVIVAAAYRVLLGNWKVGIGIAAPFYIVGFYALADLPAVIIAYVGIPALAIPFVLCHIYFKEESDAKPKHD